MAVTIKLPTQLRGAAGGAAEARVDGATVGEVLERLYDQHGELRERIVLPAVAAGATIRVASSPSSAASAAASPSPPSAIRAVNQPGRPSSATRRRPPAGS